ncbi:MAG: FAD-dependent oxidoreductase [Chloroflexi bacterium]|nr:FAD-dependent oxidoreductase [Chloroflexota bacterium]
MTTSPETQRIPLPVAAADDTWWAQNIPCQIGCPANTDIPGYIDLVAKGRYDDAYELNRRDNVFPGLLGRVCAAPCEPVCRRAKIDNPIAIRWIKRAAADFRSNRMLPKRPPITRKQRVAVVGAGPTGLAAARDLRELGYRVVVFDKYSVPGGMFTGAIVPWRLPREICRAEIDDYFEALGVEIRLNTHIGKDIPLADLLGEHDAVYLAAGTQDPQRINIPGETLRGVVPGLPYVEKAIFEQTEAEVMTGKRVAVIGGGFTAMDCARSAYRLGAKKVWVLYRRSRMEILVDDYERETTESEAVDFQYMVAPVRVVSNDGVRASGVELIRTRLGEPDERGRRRPVPIEGSNFVLECDTVIAATGQNPDYSWIPPELGAEVRNGRLVVDPKTWMTKAPGLFAGGDFVAGARNLISCIADGHKAAQSMHQYLSGEELKRRKPELTVIPANTMAAGMNFNYHRVDQFDTFDRQHMVERPMAQRWAMDREVELGYTEQIAHTEATRCLQCDLNIAIDGTRCILCGGCVDVCPQGVIKMVHPAEVAVVNSPGLEQVLREEYDERKDAVMAIDEERCIRCAECIIRCPTQCISFIHFEPYAVQSPSRW